MADRCAVLVTGHVAPKQPGRSAEAAGLPEVLDAVRVAASAAGVTIDVAQAPRKISRVSRF